MAMGRTSPAGRGHASAFLIAFLLAASGLATGSLAQDRPPAGNAGSVAIPPPAAIATPSGVPTPSGHAAPAPTAAAAARARANDDMDRLRNDIRLLTELHAAQKALGGWNRLRAAAGEPAARLDPALCGELGRWCRALPGTFGPGREGDGP